MDKRPLGKSGLQIAPWALGGNVFGWTINEETSFKVLDQFVAEGFNFIDTADVYSRWVAGHQGGESETIIGRWLKKSGQRKNVIIATKVGMDMGGTYKGLSRKHILHSVDKSLARLQTEWIDLYQSHQDDPETPLEETLETFAELIRQGKVKAIGASNYSAPRLEEALKVSERLKLPRYESLQPLYNLYSRSDYEEALEPLCREKNIGVISYFSLASGFLTGKYRNESDTGKSLRGAGIRQKYLNPRGFRILKALDQVAERKQATPAQVALAWLIARPGLTAPIASATSAEQVKELAQAVRLKLDSADVSLLNESSRE